MKVDLVTDWRGFTELEKEWNSLLVDSTSDIVFLRWEWVETWRRVHGHWVKPFIVVVSDESGGLVGIAPYYRTRYELAGLLNYRVLRVLGDFPTGAECLDWILRRGREEEAARNVAAALVGARAEWDFLWMPYVPSWTGARDRISAAAKNAGLYVSERLVQFGYLPLPASVDEMLASLKSSQRYAVRRDLKRLFARPGTRFVRCTEENEIPRFLDALFRLHAIRWGRRGLPGTFRKEPNEARFYRLFAPLAFRQGWLGLFGIEMSGELKAVQYGYIYNGIYLQMQEGFDIDSEKNLGNLLRWKAIEALIDSGVKGYDFLGEMSEHKARWHVVERRGSHLMAGNVSSRNRILFSAGIWPTGRYLKHAELDLFRGKGDSG